MAGKLRLDGAISVEVSALLVAPPDHLAAPSLKIVQLLAAPVDMDGGGNGAQRRLAALSDPFVEAHQIATRLDDEIGLGRGLLDQRPVEAERVVERLFHSPIVPGADDILQ